MAWKKGQSGNPKGRPKKDVFIEELAQAHTEEAIATLAFVMRNGEGRERVAASVALLDRGWGKPHQTSESYVETETRFVIESPAVSSDVDQWQSQHGNQRLIQ